MSLMNLLFICTYNEVRSRTGQEIFGSLATYEAKSAGTDPWAKVKVSPELLRWADVVIVMENVHRQFLYEKFEKEAQNIKIFVLNIPDDYYYMQPELVEILKEKVEGLIL